MHIPDGFLTSPVWITFDAISVVSVGWIAKNARTETQDHKIPFLGVMGAFVFAAQMINFPVGPGTSSHLLGGTLLAILLGPASASLVMTAILVLQALIFQDGGILALGTNIFNMALVGVIAGYLPYRLWGKRPAAIFAGGALSVLTSACLALSQLMISGVRMPNWIALSFFVVSGLLEGAITVAAVRGIERLNPTLVTSRSYASSRLTAVIGLIAVILVIGGTLVASASPDGIQRLTMSSGIDAAWVRRAMGGVGGLILIYAICTLGSKLLHRRSA